MEIGIYLLKSVAILTIFYVVYFIFLRKDTLFTAKRHYLLGGIIASLFLPFLEFTKTIYKEAPVFEPVTLSESMPAVAETFVANEAAAPIDWWQLALWVYALGVLFMLGRLLYQLISLLRLIATHPSEKQKRYTFVRVSENISPFSFFRYIVYNPQSHSEEELQMILKHEQVHASQWHSIDIIIGNVARILQWINPFSWFYKKSLEENLEYIADNETVAQLLSKKEYQLTLVKASSTVQVKALTTQFYQSFIKKRIIMLNKSTSKRRNIWKLSIVLPALALFLWSFNVTEVVSYKAGKTPTAEVKDKHPVFKILATSTEDQLNEMEHHFATRHPEALIKIKDRSRDSKGNLIAFSFNTKFKSNSRFYKRFEVNKNKNEGALFKGYQVRFSEGPALFVKHLNSNGEHFKITEENLQFLTDVELVADYLPTKPEPVLGDNPLYIINGVHYTKHNLPELEKMSSSGGIVLYNKKDAVAKFGEKAKDGAMHFKGETTFISEEEEEEEEIPVTNDLKNEREVEDTALTNETEVEAVAANDFKYEITKNTTDQELKTIKDELKKEHDVNFSYAVTRNNAQEITSISITYSSKTGNNGSYSINDDGPIEDFTFFFNEEGRSGFWSEGMEERRMERMAKRVAEMEERSAERAVKMEERVARRLEEQEKRRIKMAERRVELAARNNNLAKLTEEERKMMEKEMKLREKELAKLTGEERKLIEKEMKLREIELAKRSKELAKRSKNRTISRTRSGNTNSFTYANNGEGVENAVIIDKDTSDATLEKIKTKLAAKGITFNYSKVKRNSQGEITRIKITTNNGKGSKSTISSATDDGEPINDILIEI
ncbi:MAG: M56 family metallopeptidase [Bacteroidota bacterium]